MWLQNIIISGNSSLHVANWKPYVYDPETVCLHLVNHMFTTRNDMVYDP